MKRWMGTRFTGASITAALVLTACVTINVYFPAAEAKEAAKEFVENVIDHADKVEIKTEGENGGGMAWRLPRIDPLALIGIAPAYAQGAPDIAGDWQGTLSVGQVPGPVSIAKRMDGPFDPATAEVTITRPDGTPYEIGPSHPWTTPATRTDDPTDRPGAA